MAIIDTTPPAALIFASFNGSNDPAILAASRPVDYQVGRIELQP